MSTILTADRCKNMLQVQYLIKLICPIELLLQDQFPTKCTLLDRPVVDPSNHDSLSIRNVIEVGVAEPQGRNSVLANCSDTISAIEDEDSDRGGECRKICPFLVEDASKYFLLGGRTWTPQSICNQKPVSCTYELHTPCRV